MVVYGTYRVATNPASTARVVERTVVAVQQVAIGAIDIIQGAYLRRGNTVVEGLKHLGYGAAALGDAAVYGLDVIIPFIPIGRTWAIARGQY